MITIALIDKHPILRTGLSIFLKNQFDEVTILESDSVARFHETFPDQDPNLIIVGASLHSDFVEPNLVVKLKKWYRIESVIVYDEKTDSPRITHFLKAGVKGYILKHDSLTEVIHCVMEVLEGKRYVCKEVFELIIEKHLSRRNGGRKRKAY